MSDSAAFAGILSQLARLLKGLSQEEMQRIADGDTRMMFVPKGSKVVTPLNLPALAADIRRLGSQDDIMQLLNSDSRLTATALRTLADELNIDLPPAAKNKGSIQLHIAQSAAAHWRRIHGGL